MNQNSVLIDTEERPLSTTEVVPGIPMLDVNVAGVVLSSSIYIKNTLVTVAYDYIDVTYPSAAQEVYTFKVGGSGGSTVATVTVNYTDSTKVSLLNVGVV